MCWLVAARILIGDVDATGYATYMLVAGLVTVLPFADLGMGASVMDAFARRGEPNAPDPVRVFAKTWKLLCFSALVIAVVGVAMGVAGFWTTLLGLPASRSLNSTISICTVLLAIGVPLGLGQRVLTGLGKNHYTIFFQSLSAVVMFALVLILSQTESSVHAYVLAPFSGLLIANFLSLIVALRLSEVRFREEILAVSRSGLSDISVRKVAGPMLVITLVLPLAYQMDRVILSHAASSDAVAQYSLSYQLFAPLLGVLGSAGAALWPIFAKQRTMAMGLRRSTVALAEGSFLAVGSCMAIGLVLVTPYVAGAVSSSQVHISAGLTVAFATLLVLQAASYPLAMVLTSAHELRIQAVLHVGMLLANLPLSVVLAFRLGASGPVIASLLSVAVALFIPQVWRVLRLTRSQG
ncbi:oligosaccharide flippase family protein [Janibacter melonis]|uniref:oligosaccharide flippase family protein n=1 Tax=Janibacter melonis TaxID=262209 RepID=UPI00174D9206|nr:oligosaccharide flippase family protein [Janibacter melonis]